MAIFKVPSSIPYIAEERRSQYGLQTYVSLFSSAGVGCYGFKQENFYCIATVELLERRLKIQKYNNKCAYDSGYICGDMTSQETKNRVFNEISMWKRNYNLKDLDVLIATPPCQGMSVANHKKKDELKRNSLVVESIYMTKEIKPKFFIFENVRAFLNAVCTDLDEHDKTIRQAIEQNLSGLYNISFKVLNFKDYGCPSSRTRTLVIGIRRDMLEITPYDISPDFQTEQTLRQTIGHLRPLKVMGEISPDDIFHGFRRYAVRMESWISCLKEGESAFDNEEPSNIPHSIKDGVIVYNVKKNGDKYTRQYWDKVAPCIHTRNDILASQNTIHPCDNRVFSIRELMLMMSIPQSFQWSDISFDRLNKLPLKEKELFLKKEEINIRQNIGEAVPTIIFRQIAKKIRAYLCTQKYSDKEIYNLIDNNNLTEHSNLLNYIKKRVDLDFVTLSKIAELTNMSREDNAAYYTRQDICYSIVNCLPEPDKFTNINILEPSIGVGNFIPVLIHKYKMVPKVNIDVVDIDGNSIEIFQILIGKLHVPENITIRYINDDFLLHDFDKHYDIIVGNPPYKKITKEKLLLKKYKKNAGNKDTNNLFAFFIEKAVKLGDVVSFVVPKSLISAPEFNNTRRLMEEFQISHLTDFGEKGFKGVKIETVCFTLDTTKRPDNTKVDSYITYDTHIMAQNYIFDKSFPYWLIYRNDEFDAVANRMRLNVFKVFRDRCITKTITSSYGAVRVLKSRNIGDNTIIDIPGYDCFMEDVGGFNVSKFLNKSNCVLIPNLTYDPRACLLPLNCIADGSVAILTLIDDSIQISAQDLAFYATKEFKKFYAVSRNLGTRSLNIDNNSVFFFGIMKASL